MAGWSYLCITVNFCLQSILLLCQLFLQGRQLPKITFDQPLVVNGLNRCIIYECVAYFYNLDLFQTSEVDIEMWAEYEWVSEIRVKHF